MEVYTEGARGMFVTRIYAVAAIALLASTALFAQEFRGTFSGLVTDAVFEAI